MITCYIQYTLDPAGIDDFRTYATTWPPIIERCGGDLVGYYLTKEGTNTTAIALIDFESLAHYEIYRERLAADPDAIQNVKHARHTRCIQLEARSFLQKL